MVCFLIGHIFSTLIALIRVSRLSENDKDLEIGLCCKIFLNG